MFAGFEPFDIPVELDVTIHGVKGGSGPALLLLHGFPQTHHIWHRVAEQLAQKYSVVAMDLRGYGQSTKPDGGEGHHRYGKKSMARDAITVMEALGKRNFYICAHDRGARVAHRLCVDYPDRVYKAVFLDICPTLAMYSKTDFDFARSYFHWFFLIQKAPLPEDLIVMNPSTWVEEAMGGRHAALDSFAPACLAKYHANLSDWQTVHAMCEDYRASASIDLKEAKQDLLDGRHIQCPLKVIWGAHGVIEKCFDAIEEWSKVSVSTVAGKALDCGHYIPEEQPEELLVNLLDFFQKD